MGKKSRRKKAAEEVISSGNLTLSNYANATKSSKRVVKSLSNVKLFIASSNVEHDTEDLEDDDQHHLTASRPAQNASENVSWKGGIIYPFDLWDILSQYILPESISIYARLCHGAYLSVNRVSFWLNMYEKRVLVSSRAAFVKTGCESLPERLREEYVNKYCRGNLRTNVIRALFYTHQPFRERLSSLKSHVDPHSIVGLTCLAAWTARKLGMFKFCFKLTSKPSWNHSINNKVADDWEAEMPQADVDVSHEESCKLLQLDCDAFSLLPGAIPGLKILDINVTSSGEGFRYQKVTMTMGPPHLRVEKDSKGRYTAFSPHSISLSIGNIMAIRLLDWFHPLYTG